jgi:hypothetical protein
MKGLRELFKHVTRRRPPTGPLTTAEAVDAEELRLRTPTADSRRNERDQAKTDAGSSPDPG